MTDKPLNESASTPAADHVDRPADHVDRPALTDAARRALAEAEARRAAMQTVAAEKSTEVGGRGGLDPARYGDWEVKGVASDF